MTQERVPAAVYARDFQFKPCERSLKTALAKLGALRLTANPSVPS